jgi:hypothetical protein
MKFFLLLIVVLGLTAGCSGSSSTPCSAGPSNGESCDVDQQSCTGAVACRSCNGALGLFELLPAFSCECTTGTVNGKTALYWQCALIPACTAGPGAFTDSKCTVPAGG